MRVEAIIIAKGLDHWSYEDLNFAAMRERIEEKGLVGCEKERAMMGTVVDGM